MSDPTVYDKAKYHYGGNYPKGLSKARAFVHTGMFLGWIIDHDLYSDLFKEESPDLIAAFKNRQITGAQVYKKWDGTLTNEMLSDEGDEFAQYYFYFEKGGYIYDYEELLGKGLPTIYHVEDGWQNYEKLKRHIDSIYDEWKERRK